MNPYEKTAQEMKRQSEGPKRFAKASASAIPATGAMAFSPLLSRAAPFLSKYIPDHLVVKGLTKISPKFGNFIKSAMGSGYELNEIKDFIGEQIDQSNTQQQAKENRNVIEQYSPELHQFILNQVKEGRSPLEAGALAFQEYKGGPGFKKIIDKIVNDHKAPWSSIIQSVYGSGETTQPVQQQINQNPSAGSGQEALMSILQKIQQARGM